MKNIDTKFKSLLKTSVAVAALTILLPAAAIAQSVSFDSAGFPLNGDANAVCAAAGGTVQIDNNNNCNAGDKKDVTGATFRDGAQLNFKSGSTATFEEGTDLFLKDGADIEMTAGTNTSTIKIDGTGTGTAKIDMINGAINFTGTEANTGINLTGQADINLDGPTSDINLKNGADINIDGTTNTASVNVTNGVIRLGGTDTSEENGIVLNGEADIILNSPTTDIILNRGADIIIDGQFGGDPNINVRNGADIEIEKNSDLNVDKTSRMTVSGAATFDTTSVVNFQNGFDLEGVANFGGASSIAADGHASLTSLNVSGESEFNDNVQVNARLRVGTGADATILRENGNATIGNNLRVNNNATIGNNLNVSNNLDVAGRSDFGGDTFINQNGTLSVGSTDTTRINGNNGNIVQSGGTRFNAGTGNATIGNNLTVNGNATVQGNSTVNGNTQLNGNLAIKGPNLPVPGAVIDMGGNRVQNVAAPVDSLDATNKAYVDAADAALGRRIDDVEEGVAVSMAIQNPDLVGAEKFGLSANWANFEGANAFGFAATGVIGQNLLGSGERTAVTAGVGVGTDNGNVGGRAGVQFTW